MKENIKNILNQQIMEEFYSAYLYLALAARLENLNFPGMANWMKLQAKEEEDHALGFFRFLIERGEEPELLAIAAPDISKIKTPVDAFAAALEHEQHVTSLIHKIQELAITEKDYALESFNRWYIDEQVEEEDNANDVLSRVKMVSNSGSGLYALDRELAKREAEESGPYAKED